MIRMKRGDIKNINMGKYYTKVNDVYVIGDDEDFELLERLYVAEGHQRVVFKETILDKIEVKYHYFSFDIQLYRVYDSIQGLLEQFGDIIVLNLDDIKPNKKSVERIAGFFDKKNIAIFGVLVVVTAGIILFLKNKENEPSTSITPTPTSQTTPISQTTSKPQQPPPPPSCHTNLPSFAKFFEYSDQLVSGKVVKSIGDKTIEIALQSIEVAPVEKADIKIPSFIDENAFNMQDAGDKLTFTINGYDNCLLFIDVNKRFPLIIDTLDTKNCSIYFEKSCIKG
jgi:hypothetical protein